MRREIIGFLISGALAFLIDAGLLQFLVMAGGDPYLCRLPSLTIAILFTWWINRRWSFQVHRPPGMAEFITYVAAIGLGGLINIGVYFLLIRLYLADSSYPALAIIPATALSMSFNFIAIKYVVFRRQK